MYIKMLSSFVKHIAFGSLSIDFTLKYRSTMALELLSQSKSFILRGTWYRYTLDTPTVPNQFRLSVQIRLV